MALVTDIFSQNGWGVIDFHEEIVERLDFRPQLLGSLGIFEAVYSRSRTIAIADRDRTLSLIPTSEMGAYPVWGKGPSVQHDQAGQGFDDLCR